MNPFSPDTCKWVATILPGESEPMPRPAPENKSCSAWTFKHWKTFLVPSFYLTFRQKIHKRPGPHLIGPPKCATYSFSIFSLWNSWFLDFVWRSDIFFMVGPLISHKNARLPTNAWLPNLGKANLDTRLIQKLLIFWVSKFDSKEYSWVLFAAKVWDLTD